MLHVISNPSAEYNQSRNGRIRGIYKYWDSKRQGRRMPSRSDMDPVEIPEFLSNVILVDVFYEPLWFRYRLVGTDRVKKRGFDPTGGRIWEKLPWNDSHSVTEYFREIAGKRCVQFADYPFAEPRGWYVYSDRIMMPQSNDNDIANMVFIYALWKDAPGRVSDPEDAP